MIIDADVFGYNDARLYRTWIHVITNNIHTQAE